MNNNNNDLLEALEQVDAKTYHLIFEETLRKKITIKTAETDPEKIEELGLQKMNQAQGTYTGETPKLQLITLEEENDEQ